MNRMGHYGINLTLGSVGLIALSALNAPFLGLAAFVTIGAVASLPDIDHQSTAVPILKHRGWTHTVYFAALVGALIAGAGYALTTLLSPHIPLESPRFWPPNATALGVIVAAGGGAVGVLGHLAGDIITPRGITPFNPILPRIHTARLPDTSWSLDLTTAGNKKTNALLGFVGMTTTALGLYSAMEVVTAAFP